jgi:hypothetical protein
VIAQPGGFDRAYYRVFIKAVAVAAAKFLQEVAEFAEKFMRGLDASAPLCVLL